MTDDEMIVVLWSRLETRGFGDRMAELVAEVKALREPAALGLEIEYEIERWGDPYLMGVRARVSAGDGFTQQVAP